MTKIPDNSWTPHLKSEFSQSYFIDLNTFLNEEYNSQTIYPPRDNIFTAFELCPLNKVKVVIIGQDPYHGDGQAHGLAFSINKSIKIPPSLRNIFQEISTDIGTPPPENGNLERWAKQGVLLLNNTLTVRASSAGSHRNHGWEKFTTKMLQIVGENRAGVVYLLWGRDARAQKHLINPDHNLILEAPHPSPFSAYTGFFGCHHFSQANNFLANHHLEPIIW